MNNLTIRRNKHYKYKNDGGKSKKNCDYFKKFVEIHEEARPYIYLYFIFWTTIGVMGGAIIGVLLTK
jgi:hypothetical protein